MQKGDGLTKLLNLAVMALLLTYDVEHIHPLLLTYDVKHIHPRKRSLSY